MPKKVGSYNIPFDANGNQLHYDDWKTHKRIPNFEFEDTLTFSDMERGRSAAYFYFKRSDGTKVVVFMKDMTEMIHKMFGGTVTGTFSFV